MAKRTHPEHFDDPVMRRLAELERQVAALARQGVARSCRVYQTSAPTLTNGNQLVLSFGNEEWDVGGMHDNAVNNTRLTATIAGRYQCGACVPFDTNATGRRSVLLRKTEIATGTTRFFVTEVGQAVAGSLTVLNVFGPVWLEAGDYVECFALQASGGDLALNIQEYGPSFWAELAT